MQNLQQQSLESLIIREVHQGDIAVLERLFPKKITTTHAKRFSRHLQKEAVYLIALLHDVPVGHVLLLWGGMPEKEVSEKIQNCPAVEDILVDEVHRSLGIGTRLLDECVKRVKEAGYTKIGLAVGVGNVKAKQFYLQNGFLDSGISDFYVQWPTIDLNTGQETMDGEMCRFFIKHL